MDQNKVPVSLLQTPFIHSQLVVFGAQISQALDCPSRLHLAEPVISRRMGPTVYAAGERRDEKRCRIDHQSQ